ncbi:TonB-dependent receptor [Acanthopleuribacter pedis]
MEAHAFRARLEHAFSDRFEATLNAYFGDHDKRDRNFFVIDYLPRRNIVRMDGFLDTSRRENLVFSGDLAGVFSTGRLTHRLLGGVEFTDTDTDQTRYNAYFDTSAADVARGVRGARTDIATFSVMRPIDLRGGVGTVADGRVTSNDFTVDLQDDLRIGIQVFSMFLQDELAFSEKVHAILGARFDHYEIEALDTTHGALGTKKLEKTTPRLGLVYKPKTALSLYASYSETFSPRRGRLIANTNDPNNQLDPNTSNNLEAGVKWAPNQDVNLSVTLFKTEQESPVVSDADAGTFDVIRTAVEGVEAELKGWLTEPWFVSVGFSYMDGSQADSARRPRELPRTMFSAWNYLYLTERLSVGLGVTHQDEVFISNRNEVFLPSYTRFDAGAYYEVATWRIQINIENLADARYFPNATSAHQVTVGAPLNARLSFRGRF